MDIDRQIENNLQNYFNVILKRSLRYPESFVINSDVNSRRIQVTSNAPSQLIQQLNNNRKLLNNVESSLLNGFKAFDPSIRSLQINVISNDRLEINYTVQKLLTNLDIGPYVNIARNLDRSQLADFCSVNPQFFKLCGDPLFITALLEERYPDNNYLKVFSGSNYNLRLLKKIELYDFIIINMPLATFNNMISKMQPIGVEFFTSDYQEFITFQRDIINGLSNEDLDFNLETKDLIEDGALDIMDKEDMNPILCTRFYFIEDETSGYRLVLSQ